MATQSSTNTSKAAADHGWFGTETVKTRAGDFDFKGSYPSSDSATRLRDTLVFNRAVEAYLVQMHGVSWYRVWKGVLEAGTKTPNQVVLWENLMMAGWDGRISDTEIRNIITYIRTLGQK